MLPILLSYNVVFKHFSNTNSHHLCVPYINVQLNIFQWIRFTIFCVIFSFESDGLCQLQKSLLDESISKANETTVSKARAILIDYRREMANLSVPMLQKVSVCYATLLIIYASSAQNTRRQGLHSEKKKQNEILKFPNFS